MGEGFKFLVFIQQGNKDNYLYKDNFFKPFDGIFNIFYAKICYSVAIYKIHPVLSISV